MSGLVQVILTDNELQQLGQWYLTHRLAEENSTADDRLADRLSRAHMAVSCVPHIEGANCRAK